MKDKNYIVTKSELIKNPMKLRSHVVILGAGASVASFPQGDANGKILPIMNNLIEVLNIQEFLKKCNVDCFDQNFENIYSKIYTENPNSYLLKDIEKSIHEYFKSLVLPDYPTIYDHLLLSLRPKDAVVTFNWDPFLFDSWERNLERINLPQIVHLHGNVRIGYCLEHRLFGKVDTFCPECDKQLTPSKLLFPVSEKNYSIDPFIHSEWKTFKYFLENAFTITVFGYGAPTTDMEAVGIMKEAWKEKSQRQLETTEFIDIKKIEIIREQWKPFIYSHHYLHFTSFYESWIPNHPRRSCEGIHAPTIMGKFVEENPLPKDMNFEELMIWLEPLINAEQSL